MYNYIEDDSDVNGYGVDYGQFNDAGRCIHGVYTGGCGIDFMCGACEMGYNILYEYTAYRAYCIVRGNRDGDYVDLITESRRDHRTEMEAYAAVYRWLREPVIDRITVGWGVYPVRLQYWGDKSDKGDSDIVYDPYNYFGEDEN